MKEEYKDKFKREPANYTATMDRRTLKALDALDGKRSHNIEKAVKAYFLIG